MALNIILDTDIGTDCDDVGAISVLHKLTSQGKCKMLAVTSSTSRRDGAGIIDVINRYYGRKLPVGMLKNKKMCDDASYGIYSRAITSVYDNDYRDNDAEDATKVLRKAISEAEQSVRIVT